jgi:hypothetical protein
MQDFIPYEHAVALKQNAHAVKGIYITEEAKKELEAKVAELENELQLVGNLFEEVERNPYYISNKIKVYQEILSSAIILPVEASWNNCDKNNLLFKQVQYPNGVIIEKKMP